MESTCIVLKEEMETGRGRGEARWLKTPSGEVYLQPTSDPSLQVSQESRGCELRSS